MFFPLYAAVTEPNFKQLLSPHSELTQFSVGNATHGRIYCSAAAGIGGNLHGHKYKRQTHRCFRFHHLFTTHPHNFKLQPVLFGQGSLFQYI
jgi:hypothetical protein